MPTVTAQRKLVMQTESGHKVSYLVVVDSAPLSVTDYARAESYKATEKKVVDECNARLEQLKLQYPELKEE